MQFSLASLLPAALLATSVMASGATITAALSDVASKALALNTTVASWDGQLFGAIPILAASGALTDSINNGTKVANASKPLTQTEALAIVSPASVLVSDVHSVLQTLQKAKPKFDALPFGIGSPLVLSILKTDKTDAAQFSSAVVAKVPTVLQSVAASIVAPIDKDFAAAIATYSK